MTDSERLEELEKQLEPLVKEKEALKDTIQKAELAKNRYRYYDFGPEQYWVKICSVGERMCDCIEIYGAPNIIKVTKFTVSFSWLEAGIATTEQVFNNKLNEAAHELGIL